MYIVWTLDKIFCRHQLGPLDLWCDLVLELVFVWMTYWQWGVLKSPTTTVLVSICAFKSFSVCAFKSFSVCLMKLGALTLDECRLIIVISFWCIYPFISMKCPPYLKFDQCKFEVYLSDISIAIPAYFLGPWLGKSSSRLMT
jgi:hypothetical protein